LLDATVILLVSKYWRILDESSLLVLLLALTRLMCLRAIWAQLLLKETKTVVPEQLQKMNFNLFS